MVFDLESAHSPVLGFDFESAGPQSSVWELDVGR